MNHQSDMAEDHTLPNDEIKYEQGHHAMHSMHSMTPFYVSVLIGVTHCGAGCVLGDIVGEWLVYGTNVTISGRNLWPEMLIGISHRNWHLHRLCFCPTIWDSIPILFYCADERRMGD